ncbi:NAD(P)-binding protein [Jaminaea rosea]|uniref:NAD(P)-binding protein n=1 Tax=Jaminaea rosea TaxID=1569628 RepID=A0A316ULZ8_9BASI|nr:NAD(P)-binding protein [Jaminaea rosea]PWN26269.1 NAD(P)-binding protein [Jaminaea rosea]
MHPAIKSGNVAVITGGASGIGLALAQLYAKQGLRVAVGDSDDSALRAVPNGIEALPVDVTSKESLASFRDAIATKFPGKPISILHANAGVGGPTKASDPEGWERIMNVNFHGVVNTVHTFLPLIKQGGQPALICNTGSKQGITTPPGSGAAYNISKAATKVFTEQLAHELRQDEVTKGNISVHLLIPGWVHTGLTGAKSGKAKPEGAWSAEQTADFCLEKINKSRDAFYVLCPDNDTPTALDQARMEYNVNDIIQDRPALSRWHPDYESQYAQFIKSKGL